MEPTGLPRFWRVPDSLMTTCYVGILMFDETILAVICDVVTFFASTNASGN